ncbi:MAG: heavy-metal-associated domain-containing protein [Pseudomonadota bacterium]|jgi:copper chaperone
MKTVTLNVIGMTCMGCARSVRNALEQIPGVAGVDIALDQGKVAVTFDPAKIEGAGLREAIEDAGYEVVA